MTSTKDGKFDPGYSFSPDIAVDNPSNPRTMSVHIKQFKTDPFRPGVAIFMGRTDAMPHVPSGGGSCFTSVNRYLAVVSIILRYLHLIV